MTADQTIFEPRVGGTVELTKHKGDKPGPSAALMNCRGAELVGRGGTHDSITLLRPCGIIELGERGSQSEDEGGVVKGARQMCTGGLLGREQRRLTNE